MGRVSLIYFDQSGFLCRTSGAARLVAQSASRIASYRSRTADVRCSVHLISAPIF